MVTQKTRRISSAYRSYVVFGAVLEYRSYESGPGELGKMSYDDEDEIAIITNRTPPPPPPPPPPAPPEVIQIVENDLEIEEVEFESTETDESEEIEIVEEEEEDDEIFNFAVVENKPIFPGCEKKATEDDNGVSTRNHEAHR